MRRTWWVAVGNARVDGFPPRHRVADRRYRCRDACVPIRSTCRLQDYYHALSAVQEPWVYSATYLKLREARLSVQFPGNFPGSPFQSVILSLIGRNLYLNAKAPNIDPESVFSAYQLPGLEMGQLPATRSVGFQIRLSP